MSPTLRTIGSLSLALTLAAGCDRNGAESPAPQAAEGPVATHEPMPPAPAPAMPTPPPAPPAVTTLTDAQSVEALGTLNHEEISLARYAHGRAHSDGARNLAQMMIDQHTQAEADIVAWAQAHQVAGAMNDVSPAVTASAAAVRTRLEAASDEDFDRAYVHSQVDMHQDALTILDQRIIPGATNPEFRTLVTNIRAAVATHLEHARETLASMPRGTEPMAASEHTH